MLSAAQSYRWKVPVKKVLSLLDYPRFYHTTIELLRFTRTPGAATLTAPHRHSATIRFFARSVTHTSLVVSSNSGATPLGPRLLAFCALCPHRSSSLSLTLSCSPRIALKLARPVLCCSQTLHSLRPPLHVCLTVLLLCNEAFLLPQESSTTPSHRAGGV